MNYYLDRNNVNYYTQMVNGKVNTFIINEIHKHLTEGSTLLELGMGTGSELIQLSKYYKVLGSDYSPLFLEDFKEKSHLDVVQLDARTLLIDQVFDAIYSNKVLQQFTFEEFKQSLSNQVRHLTPNGKIFLTLWHGHPHEAYYANNQLRCHYYDETTILESIPKESVINDIIYYEEVDKEDSIFIILSKK